MHASVIGVVLSLFLGACSGLSLTKSSLINPDVFMSCEPNPSRRKIEATVIGVQPCLDTIPLDFHRRRFLISILGSAVPFSCMASAAVARQNATLSSIDGSLDDSTAPLSKSEVANLLRSVPTFTIVDKQG